MKPLIVAILLVSAVFAQAPAISVPQPAAPKPPAAAPAESDNARQARAAISQMLTALGGQAYLTFTDRYEQGRRYLFDRNGQLQGGMRCLIVPVVIVGIPKCDNPGGDATVFWRYWQWPNNDRWEMFPQHSWVILVHGDSATERTDKTSRPLDAV